jgi:hypothetical protein
VLETVVTWDDDVEEGPADAATAAAEEAAAALKANCRGVVVLEPSNAVSSGDDALNVTEFFRRAVLSTTNM